MDVAISRGYNGQRGGGWVNGREYYTAYNHYQSPNVNILDMNTCGYGVFAARSQLTGGVQVARCDGSTSLISNSIDLSVWRAFGTRNGGEVVAIDNGSRPAKPPSINRFHGVFVIVLCRKKVLVLVVETECRFEHEYEHHFLNTSTALRDSAKPSWNACLSIQDTLQNRGSVASFSL